jgi:hypothetical protein
MLQNLLNSLIKFIFAIIGIGLAIAIFLIGIVALWYFMLIGLVIFLVRSLYLSFKAPKSGPVEAGGVEVIIHEEQRSKPKQTRPGRVIDHE